MAFETILLDIHGKVGLITLNRPQALNALNAQIVAEVNQALDQLEHDPNIGCVVITGSAKAFAAGADIKEMAELSYPQIYVDDLFSDADRIANRRKPIIAAVSGFALGGGCELAMMCDFILAADNAKFGQPEVNLGVLPGMGGTQRLTRAVGKAKAMELCLTGRLMGAEEAERAGLVARVVPQAELLVGRSAQGRRKHRQQVGPDEHDGQGKRQPRLRGHLERGRALRASGVPRGLCHRRSEGGHGRVHRQARGAVQGPLNTLGAWRATAVRSPASHRRLVGALELLHSTPVASAPCPVRQWPIDSPASGILAVSGKFPTLAVAPRGLAP